MQEIKVVLWDVGGVIQPDDRLPPKILGVSRQRFAKAVERLEYQDYFRGRVRIAKAASFLLKSLGKDVDTKNIRLAKKAILSAWEPPRPDVVALVKRIQPGFRKMILSTVPRELEFLTRKAHAMGVYKPEQQYLQLFRPENVLFSNRIHATKHEREAFAAVRKVCGVGPTSWLFIDDRETNLKVAREFGVGHVLLYTTTDALEKELARLGVLA
ncbi:hypothetical protein HYV85_00020 [Candidatus Woesearchaeota archaeon]|nr:hypothetical protein [Candidatus Woesearchaeota archaeon]